MSRGARRGRRVLVLNAGSSSLKASLVELPSRTLGRAVVGWGSDATRSGDRGPALRSVLDELGVAEGARSRRGLRDERVDAVGHRVVHGGAGLVRPARIDDEVLAAIARISHLAPLHNEVALEVITAAREQLPRIPHVACFDTAFHASLPEEAWRYPVPHDWHERLGVRRYGFHGLSVAWSVRRAAQLLERPSAELALVVAHLGNGCSVTAVDGGRSMDTSMGFTPLEGLMMGTRSGSIDPGILLRLLDDRRLTLAELADALDHGSGLLGVSGISGDVREVEAASAAGDTRAALALAMFARRAAAGIAAATVSLPRLDALVFTGGIGEHAHTVRRAIVGRLGPLGLRPLTRTGGRSAADAVVSRAGDSVAVLRIEAREDLVIAADTGDLLEA